MKTLNFVKNDVEKDLTLTTEEIDSLDVCRDYSPSKKEALKMFVYNLSMVLYKLNKNERD